MDSRSNKRRTNIEPDRLSSLPDDLIAKILSYIGMKQAVETSVLSSRWKYIWTSVPYLNFSSQDFPNKMPKFYKFLTHVFSSCDDQVEFSLNLCGKVSHAFTKKILKDACSRNVQKLTFSVLRENRIELDLSLISSQSLKHLSLIGSDRDHCIMPTSVWELPALTTLHLDRFTLYEDDTDKRVGLFSKCANLKNLTIDKCYIRGLGSFTISHPHISNLTLKEMTCCRNVIKVVAPQLKNLTIVRSDGEHMISAPCLTSLEYRHHSLRFSVEIDSLPSLEKVDISVGNSVHANDARKVVDLLQKLCTVRFLSLSMEIIETLSSSVNIIVNQPSPFVNLQSLRIYPIILHESFKDEVTIPTEVKNYFLDSSPSATLTIVSRKELRDVRDAKLAQNLMEKLRLLLDREKAQKTSHKVVMKPQPMKKVSLDLCERVTQIHRYWADLNEQIDEEKRKIVPIIKFIQRIKDLLINLPISKKDEMQPEFSSLCDEADTVMDKIVNLMKIGCDEKRSCLGVCLHEFATEAKSSS